jgi:hypothetical protein
MARSLGAWLLLAATFLLDGVEALARWSTFVSLLTLQGLINGK